jgi:hypothetical protein
MVPHAKLMSGKRVPSEARVGERSKIVGCRVLSNTCAAGHDGCRDLYWSITVGRIGRKPQLRKKKEEIDMFGQPQNPRPPTLIAPRALNDATDVPVLCSDRMRSYECSGCRVCHGPSPTPGIEPGMRKVAAAQTWDAPYTT